MMVSKMNVDKMTKDKNIYRQKWQQEKDNTHNVCKRMTVDKIATDISNDHSSYQLMEDNQP